MMNLPQLSGMLSAGLLLWSGTNLALLDNGAHRTHPPCLSTDEDPVAAVHVAVEPIFQFENYYVNEVNPFVPYSDREIESKRMWERKQRKRNVPPAVVPEQVKPPEPPKKQIVLPKLELPAYTASAERVPKVIGSVATEDRYVLFVQMGDKEEEMKAGDKLDGWELLDMANDMARFKDPDGEVLSIPVGNALAGANSIVEGLQAAEPVLDVSGSPIPSATMDPQQILQILKDPKQAEKLLKDPEMRKMLMNPSVRAFLRQNGLEHLIR